MGSARPQPEPDGQLPGAQAAGPAAPATRRAHPGARM